MNTGIIITCLVITLVVTFSIITYLKWRKTNEGESN